MPLCWTPTPGHGGTQGPRPRVPGGDRRWVPAAKPCGGWDVGDTARGDTGGPRATRRRCQQRRRLVIGEVLAVL